MAVRGGKGLAIAILNQFVVILREDSVSCIVKLKGWWMMVL